MLGASFRYVVGRPLVVGGRHHYCFGSEPVVLPPFHHYCFIPCTTIALSPLFYYYEEKGRGMLSPFILVKSKAWGSFIEPTDEEDVMIVALLSGNVHADLFVSLLSPCGAHVKTRIDTTE